MPLSTRMWSAGKLFLLGGALLATYLIFAAAAMRVALRTREVTVPNLTDRTVNDASALLADEGLALKVEEGRRVDRTIAAGRIVSQDPPTGVVTRRQRSVKVWLSAGPRTTSVPSLVGESERSAHIRLQQDALELAGVAEVRASDYPAGTVMAQEPPAAGQGARIFVLVNRGEQPATYVMPDLIGVDGERAADVLRGRGFRVAVVGEQPYPGVPPGIVLRQHPQAGFQIASGEPISLEVSR